MGKQDFKLKLGGWDTLSRNCLMGAAESSCFLELTRECGPGR